MEGTRARHKALSSRESATYESDLYPILDTCIWSFQEALEEHCTRQPAVPGKPWTVVVKFSNCKDRESNLTISRQKCQKKFIIYQDFSTQVMQKRQELVPEMQEAR